MRRVAEKEEEVPPPPSSNCRAVVRPPIFSPVVLLYRQIMQSIRRLFASRPLLSNCIVYGSLYAGAEFSQQTLIRKILVSVLQ